jgi:hypothetical protein
MEVMVRRGGGSQEAPRNDTPWVSLVIVEHSHHEADTSIAAIKSSNCTKMFEVAWL